MGVYLYEVGESGCLSLSGMVKAKYCNIIYLAEILCCLPEQKKFLPGIKKSFFTAVWERDA